MNRRIRKQLKQVRDKLLEIDAELEFVDTLLSTGEPEEISEEPTDELSRDIAEIAKEAVDNITWTAADELPEKEGIYFKQLKELSSLKDVVIIGQVSNTLELKGYISKKDGTAGLIYRFVLSDPSDDLTVICFDKMAEEFKQYMIGTHLKITKAWKLQENKHGVIELHVGNFAKVEIVE